MRNNTAKDIRLSEDVQKNSLILETLTRTVKSPSAKIGAVLLVVIVVACLAAPLIAPYGPTDLQPSNKFALPSWEHLCGTDALGRDVFSRLLYGGRYSLLLGVVASLFGALIGVCIGCIAGFYGGKVETVIMRAMDVWSSLPGMLLSILIASSLGRGFFNTVLALSIGNVPHSVRMIRGQILSERSKEYLEAAVTINCSPISIMFRHLLPNVISPVIVSTTMGVGGTITSAATLSYIGLGIQPPSPEWGAMLADGRIHIINYPYLIAFPGLAIAITILAVNLLGDGLRDALDPKLRS